MLILFALGIIKNKVDALCLSADKPTELGATSQQLAEALLSANKTEAVNVVKFNGRLTNFYSSKFNVIKLSSEIYFSNSFSSICLAAYLSAQAHLASYGNLFIRTKWFFKPLSMIIASLLIPVILVTAIMQSTNTLPEIAFIAAVSTFSCFVLCVALKLIMLFVESKTIKKALELLKISNALNANELKLAENHLKSIIISNFAQYFACLFAFIKLLVPFRSMEK